jgi:fructosamine-3-kinase
VTGPPASATPVSGGSIDEAYLLAAPDGRRWFLKLNDADCHDMFAAEAAGLEELAAAGAIRVPRPLVHGVAGDDAYLLLEHLELAAESPAAAAELGRRLAAQHRVTQPRFGWHSDNTIGRTPQRNSWCEDWIDFLRQHRFGYQLNLARANGHDHGLLEQGQALLERLPALLAGHDPAPALLHGDLWAGNWGATPQGEPVVYDPAVYYGDREADLAMTRLFRGFPPAFYEAYQAAWPLPPGHERRAELYNLYHVLNHLNLFGGAYAGQAQRMMASLLN